MSRIKVLFVSTWNTACGIATYTKNLIDALPADKIACSVLSDTMDYNKLVS